ncbi:MAG: hypothetical protein AAF745_11100, partial [Planctomycetota bacterium]
MTYGSSWLYRIAVVIPPLALTVICLLSWIQAYTATAAIKTQVDDWKRQGIPTGHTSLVEAIDRTRSKEFSSEWADILFASWAFKDELPEMHNGGREIEQLTNVDGSPNSETERRYHQAVLQRWKTQSDGVGQAIDKLIETQSDIAQPVWLPIAIQGPHLYSSWPNNGIALFEQQAFDAALAIADQAFAMQFLTRTHAVASATTGSWSYNGLYDRYGLKHQLLENIRRSLAYDLWSDDQLRTLEDLTTLSTPLQVHWERSIQATRALTLANSQLGVFGLKAYHMSEWPGVPISAASILDSFDLLETLSDIPGVGSLNHSQKVWRCTSEFRDRQLDESIDLTAIPFAYDRHNAMLHRHGLYLYPDLLTKHMIHCLWTRTCLAVERFHQRTGRFPDALDELASIGVSSSTWHWASAYSFGYKITKPDVEAVVWIPDLSSMGSKSVVRMAQDQLPTSPGDP